MDKVKIGFPIEYECDGIIYDGLFLREPEIEELEKRLKEINKITELEQQVKKQKEVIDKANEVIDKMINIGYSSGFTQYCATGEDSEFGTRAKIIKDILKGVSE